MTKNFKSFFSVANIVNKKGQGIVEFALLCAFCVGIGLAAREAGLGEALDKAFAGTSDTAAPSAIEASRAEGTMPANVNTVINEGDIPAQKPTKTDAKYDSTSDEKNLFNYLKDLGKYFKDSDTKEDDIWNAYKGEKQYASPDAEAKARHAALAMLGDDATLTNISDDIWKAIKEDNAWAFDRDDRTIHDFLVANQGLSVAELKIRNVYFANLEDSVIATMRDNLNSDNLVNGSVYDGYLAIKKQFWPNSVTLSLAPTIADFTASSDEQRVFDYIDGANGLQAYFNQFAQLTSEEKINKVLNAFNANAIYTADGDNVTAVLNANSITDVSDDFWVQIKESKGWIRDNDDEIIKSKLNEFVAQIRSESENGMTDDEVIAELQKRNTQFKNLGSSDTSIATIKKMVSNLTEDKLDADAYAGYLAIKKQFWGNGDNVNLILADKGDNPFETRIAANAVAWVDYSSSADVVTVTKNVGDIVSYNGDNYFVNTQFTWNLNQYYHPTPAESNVFTKLTGKYVGEADVLTTVYDWGTVKSYPELHSGDIVITADNDAYVITNGGNWYSYPLDVNGQANNIRKIN